MKWRPALALICCAAAFAESLAPARQQEIERLISQEMARQSIPALSVSVGVGGEMVWSAGFGLSDVENFVPAKATTVYRLGSIAKPITAVAVMQLVEAGKIDLDAGVRRYVRAFPAKPWRITIRQLLGHLGGVRHYEGRMEEVNSTRHYADLATALKIFQDDPLWAEPGTRYHYTTYGYVLLGAALESAAGMRYMDYLRQKIFVPAAMERTRQDHVFAIVPNRARGYAMNASGQLQNSSLADTSNKVPGGGLAGPAEDLVRFALALRKGVLLKPATVEQMFTPMRARDGRPTEYGMGWNIGTLDGRKMVFHTGGQQGVSTVLELLPREGVAVAMMCNLERADLRGLAQRTSRVLVDAAPRRETTSARVQ